MFCIIQTTIFGDNDDDDYHDNDDDADEKADQVRCLETDTTFPLNSFKIVLTVRIQFTQHHHHQIAQHHHQKSDDDDYDHHMKSVQWPQKTGCRKNLLRNLERGKRRKIFYFENLERRTHKSFRFLHFSLICLCLYFPLYLCEPVFLERGEHTNLFSIISSFPNLLWL